MGEIVMMRIARTVVCGAVVIAVTLLVSSKQGAAEDEPMGPYEIAVASLGAADWPTSNTEVIGYNFDMGALDDLEGATIVEDTSHSMLVLMLDTPSIGGYWPASGYRPIVVRELKIETVNSETVAIKVEVFPSLADAHRDFVQRYVARSAPWMYWNAAGTVSGTGDVCLIRDPHFEFDAQTETWNLDPQWDAEQSRRLFGFFHNIIVTIDAESDSSLKVVDLLKDMIVAMEAQRVAANGNPELPQVQLNLAAAQVQGQPVPGASVNFSYSATWDSAACARRIFFATRIPNEKWDENYEAVPDTQHPYTFRSRGSLYFDDADNPTKVEGLNKHTSVGHHHVVMVAWGDNLLPKVIYEPLEVTD
jgi:hypothetical protein